MEGLADVEGLAVKEGERVGRITGVVGIPEEQSGVGELEIGEKPQLQQQLMLPVLLAKTNPGTTGCLTGSLDPV